MWAIGAVGILALSGRVMLNVEEPSTSTKALHAFEAGYTQANHCLNGTAYDPKNGAYLDVYQDPVSGRETITDEPKASALQPNQPSDLSFIFYPGEENPFPADQGTLAFLAPGGGIGCKDLPIGNL